MLGRHQHQDRVQLRAENVQESTSVSCAFGTASRKPMMSAREEVTSHWSVGIQVGVRGAVMGTYLVESLAIASPEKNP